MHHPHAPGLPSVSARPGVVSIQHLSKAFHTRRGSLPALADVALEIREGEFVSLLGPSGCGKTTLLRILAGLDHPTSGTARLQGFDQGRPTTAMVFQGTSTFPWMTVAQNVEYGPRMRGVPKGQREHDVDRLLRLVGLTSFADAYPHQLSEGMRQRVNIARAFATDPHILLMDEPFANLDEQNRLLLQHELLSLWEASGKTVIFVTHSIQEAVLLSDRVCVLTSRPGRVKGEMPVPLPRPRRLEELFGHPEVGALSRRLWELLREEVQRSRQEELR